MCASPLLQVTLDQRGLSYFPRDPPPFAFSLSRQVRLGSRRALRTTSASRIDRLDLHHGQRCTQSDHVGTHRSRHCKMAGPIRQSIDIKSLERYIEKTVPEIQTPLDVKQVSYLATDQHTLHCATKLPLTSSLAVWLWSKQPNLPPQIAQWLKICLTKEAAW